MIPTTRAEALYLWRALSTARQRDEIRRIPVPQFALDAEQRLSTIIFGGSGDSDAPSLDSGPGPGQIERMLTTREAADRLGTTDRHIRDLCRRGDLPAVRAGKLWRIPESALDGGTRQ